MSKLAKMKPSTKRFNQVYNDLKSEGRVKSKAEFGGALDINPTQLSGYFSGARDISDNVAAALQQVYYIPKPWLLLGVGEKRMQLPDESEVVSLLKTIREELSAIRGLLEENTKPT